MFYKNRYLEHYFTLSWGGIVMLEENILSIKINGIVVYEKAKDTEYIQKEENIIIEERSLNSNKSDPVVLPRKKV